jgi:hypothetical protein
MEGGLLLFTIQRGIWHANVGFDKEILKDILKSDYTNTRNKNKKPNQKCNLAAHYYKNCFGRV